jgi:hypothetical protein
MENISDEQLKREMVFHLYGRFAPIRDIIEKNRKNNEKLRILDVGGRGNWMKKFFPKDDVFYLDPNIDSDDKNFIKGDGCDMLLENESFDWVVSTDVFEHIPKEKRNNFLEENLRVASRGVILVAPFYTKEVKQAEINANENYKMLHDGKDHIWLKEHIENGLPDMIDFENLLKEKKIAFQKLHNNRLFIWQMLLSLEFLVDENKHEATMKEIEKFNYFYNAEVYPFDNQEPSYRKVYFIKKNSELTNVGVNESSIDDVLFLKTIMNGLNLVFKINIKNKSIIEFQAHKIEITDREIEQKENEITFIKASKFWKLRNFYIAILNKLK